MGYNLKHVMRGGGMEKSVSLPWAQQIANTTYLEGSWAVEQGRYPGINVELTLEDRSLMEVDLGKPGKTFSVDTPEGEQEVAVESESIFVESDQTGKTVNSFHWPPRKKEFRA